VSGWAVKNEEFGIKNEDWREKIRTAVADHLLRLVPCSRHSRRPLWVRLRQGYWRDRQGEDWGGDQFIRLNPTESDCSIFFKPNPTIYDMRLTIYAIIFKTASLVGRRCRLQAKAVSPLPPAIAGHRSPKSPWVGRAFVKLWRDQGGVGDGKRGCKLLMGSGINVNQTKSNHFLFLATGR